MPFIFGNRNGLLRIGCRKKQEKFMEEIGILPAVNENYGDFIVQYNKNINGPVEYASNHTFQILDANLAILYVPLEETDGMPVNSYSYNSIPKCYTYMDQDALSSSGISRLQNHPYLQLRGRGTAVAVIDSGIDYTHPAFLAGKRTRIAAIWDQTQQWDQNGHVPYGREYTREQIQEALEKENPYLVVPTIDEDGHGTFLAGIAAGSNIQTEGFSGVAPEASLIIVKLKQAKKYLKELYLLPSEAAAFQENDIMLGIWYAAAKAREWNMPLSICIGLGTNQGSHTGGSPLEQYMDSVTHFSQNVISVAGGNEGNSRSHFFGTVGSPEHQVGAELRVGEEEEGFVTELWGNSPRFYTVSVQSPTGEILPVSGVRGNGKQILSFVFVETKIEVSYISVERETGESLFFFRFLQPAAGIWRFLVSGDRQQEMSFHMWLPSSGFISDKTYFIQSSPYTTITSPGNGKDVITATAYDYRNEGLYLAAGRGYSASGYVKPDLAAPGVEVMGPAPGEKYVRRSGTSIAAAQTAGAAILLFEWAIVRENAPYLNGTSVKNYLIRGAKRKEGLEYPNADWGYGILDLYRVFEELL